MKRTRTTAHAPPHTHTHTLRECRAEADKR
jgi:hypothetical protein